MNLPIPVRCFSAIGVLLLTLQYDVAWAQTPVAGKLYERNCMKCHGPKPARFARSKLKLKDGALFGSKSGRPVRDVLKKHFGVRLTPEQTNALIEALRQHL
jgi:hypothetical protein